MGPGAHQCHQLFLLPNLELLLVLLCLVRVLSRVDLGQISGCEDQYIIDLANEVRKFLGCNLGCNYNELMVL
jgi:hypothetical protein